MDGHVLKQIRDIRSDSLEGFAVDLGRTLAETAGGALAARDVEDGFGAVLKRARGGVPQVVGNEADAAVVISMGDLATLLATAREPTLAEALKEAGFEPSRRERSVVKERAGREAIRRVRPST